MSAPDARSVICPHCGAGIGAGCTTRTGRRATFPHNARFQPLLDARRDGYKDGQDDLLESPEWYARARTRWLEQREAAS